MERVHDAPEVPALPSLDHFALLGEHGAVVARPAVIRIRPLLAARSQQPKAR